MNRKPAPRELPMFGHASVPLDMFPEFRDVTVTEDTFKALKERIANRPLPGQAPLEEHRG